MATTKKANKNDNISPRCSCCGMPNPEHDEGYSLCCGKYLVYSLPNLFGEIPNDYVAAKRRWESR